MRTQEANSIHCNDYLEKIGAKLARKQNGTNGLEYVYHSPTREDAKPSLCVNLDRNIWSDVPAGEGGRTVDLVCYTNGLPRNFVSEALAILDRLYDYRVTGRTSAQVTSPNTAISQVLGTSESRATGLKEERVALKLKNLREIYRYPLKSYLASRKIPLELANLYLKEVEYTDFKGRDFYSLGFKSGETFALRNALDKRFLGKGIDISVFDTFSSEIYLFEGAFDFLSYLAHTKRLKLPVTALVMNSTALRGRVVSWVKKNPHVKRVNCYLDNDKSGKVCFDRLKDELPNTELSNCSSQYSWHKDFSDWYVEQ